MRKKRKKEHVENYLKTSFEGNNLFDNIFIEHNAIPELDFSEINTEVEFLGKTIAYPLIINAMTGGTEFSEGINQDLSLLAKEFNIPMAVGSETILMCEEEACRESFKIVRKNMGANGVVMANLNGFATVEEVKEALSVIDGDAIQIHLNTAQELSMVEGDRDFRGIMDNIRRIKENVDKPIIIKEVGFGISKDVATRLYDMGIRYIDIAGHGGTNFIEIENLRNMNIDLTELYSWGIPTAYSLMKCRQLPKDLNITSSGGIKTSTEIVKSLILGANQVAISGELLAYLVHGGYENAQKYLEGLMYKMKMIMLMLGKKNLEELRNTDFKIRGKLKDMIEG